MRAAAVVLGTRPLVGDTVSSLVSGSITGEGGALSMLEWLREQFGVRGQS